MMQTSPVPGLGGTVFRGKNSTGYPRNCSAGTAAVTSGDLVSLVSDTPKDWQRHLMAAFIYLFIVPSVAGGVRHVFYNFRRHSVDTQHSGRNELNRDS